MRSARRTQDDPPKAEPAPTPAPTPDPAPAAPAAADPVAAAIEQLGGKVDRQDMDPTKPIVAVNFGVAKIKPEDLDKLKGLGTLAKLTLNNNPEINDAAAERLKGLELGGLKKLYLVDTKLTDAGLAHLKEIASIEVISLVGTEITDATLEHLKAMPNLKEVFLHGTKATDDAVKKLKEAKPELKIDR